MTSKPNPVSRRWSHRGGQWRGGSDQIEVYVKGPRGWGSGHVPEAQRLFQRAEQQSVAEGLVGKPRVLTMSSGWWELVEESQGLRHDKLRATCHETFIGRFDLPQHFKEMTAPQGSLSGHAMKQRVFSFYR